MITRSGNMLVDRMDDDMNVRMIKCGHCDGTGRVEWEDYEYFADELSHRIYKLKKFGKEPSTWKDALRMARQLKKDGQECDICCGEGEVEA